MGRYYDGDINGKFWFGCQSSDDGEFFGATESPYVDYTIHNESINDVYDGIEKCKEALGDHIYLFNDAYNGFLDRNKSWTELNKERQKELYKWFARLDMGIRILTFFIENPDADCQFTAEF